MKPLGDLLPQAPNELGGEQGQPAPPDCSTCEDAGIVLTRRGGELRACPDCGHSMPLDERARLAGFGRAYELDEWIWAEAQEMREAYFAAAELLNGKRSIVFIRASCGSGKTLLAKITGCEHMRRGYSAVFWNMPELLDRIRETFQDRGEDSQFDFIRRNIYGFSMVILDDLGSVKPTAWSTMITYQIINHIRNTHDSGDDVRLFVTSNVRKGAESDANGDWIDDRVLSRLSPGEINVEGAVDRRPMYER